MVRVPVDYGDGRKVEVECPYLSVVGDNIYYVSQIHTNPVTKKKCYVRFNAKTGEVEIIEVK